MRELIINRIKDLGWLDWSYKRGDENAANFKNYVDWLASLSDEDLLETYDRVRDIEESLD